MSVKLIIDSSSDISKSEADSLGITMIPMLITIGDKEYYSEVNKTSVVDYLLRMIESGTLNTNQKNLFNALLAYGAAAQNNFDYKTDQLATEKYYMGFKKFPVYYIFGIEKQVKICYNVSANTHWRC
jgi:hypothetical protein